MLLQEDLLSERMWENWVHRPELLLSCSGVQAVLQLRTQTVELLPEVSAGCLSFPSRHLLRLQVLLQLCEQRLQIPHPLQRRPPLSALLIQTVKTKITDDYLSVRRRFWSWTQESSRR